jgi:valyl-tRNA synthetase
MKDLEERLYKVKNYIESLEKRLATESYIAHAPAEIVSQTRDELTSQQELYERLSQELTVL